MVYFVGVWSVPELSIWLALRQVLLWFWFAAVVLDQTGPPALAHTLRALGRGHWD